jgi:dTDP-4-amino-4,6-dideoxy-D-glucose acyltransferase
MNKINNSFYAEEELSRFGFNRLGKNVRISQKASIYNPEEISIGSNVRIDDFCILSGKIILGSYIHISAYSALYGKFGVTLEDYVTISGRVLIYSQTDDYSGEFMTNPTLPEDLIKVTGGEVIFKKHSIVAAGSIIFPGVTIEEGTAIGGMSLVNKNTEPWKIYAGIPAKPIKDRHRNPLNLEKLIPKL